MLFCFFAKVNCDFLSCNYDFFLGILNLHLTFLSTTRQKSMVNFICQFWLFSQFWICNLQFYLSHNCQILTKICENYYYFFCKSCMFRYILNFRFPPPPWIIMIFFLQFWLLFVFFLGILNLHLAILLLFSFPPRLIVTFHPAILINSTQFCLFLKIVRYNLRFVRKIVAKAAYLHLEIQGCLGIMNFYLTFLIFYSQNCEI